ncbi:hypothetical protein CB1_002245003 [Camelus ferus]|nr:hypothetical protein CB1_002245003 [Camelus ferus]
MITVSDSDAKREIAGVHAQLQPNSVHRQRENYEWMLPSDEEVDWRDRWCCALPMPGVAAGSAHHQQAGPTAAAQHRTPVAPFSPPWSRSLASSRGIRDADRANSSSWGKREDRDWRGACVRA